MSKRGSTKARRKTGRAGSDRDATVPCVVCGEQLSADEASHCNNCGGAHCEGCVGEQGFGPWSGLDYCANCTEQFGGVDDGSPSERVDEEAGMRVLFKAREVSAAFRELRSALKQEMPKTVSLHWSFPGHGSTGKGVRTWSRGGASAIAVGVGAEGDWGNRTPILIAPSPAVPRICPVVEVNVPTTTVRPERGINGCFGRDAEDGLWLLHRGTRLTATGRRVTKAEVHAAFDHHLIDVDDGGQVASVIQVARVDDAGLVAALRTFALRVQAFKTGEPVL